MTGRRVDPGSSAAGSDLDDDLAEGVVDAWHGLREGNRVGGAGGGRVEDDVGHRVPAHGVAERTRRNGGDGEHAHRTESQCEREHARDDAGRGPLELAECLAHHRAPIRPACRRVRR